MGDVFIGAFVGVVLMYVWLYWWCDFEERESWIAWTRSIFGDNDRNDDGEGQ